MTKTCTYSLPEKYSIHTLASLLTLSWRSLHRPPWGNMNLYSISIQQALLTVLPHPNSAHDNVSSAIITTSVASPSIISNSFTAASITTTVKHQVMWVLHETNTPGSRCRPCPRLFRDFVWVTMEWFVGDTVRTEVRTLRYCYDTQWSHGYRALILWGWFA